jgi:hypothetical protein
MQMRSALFWVITQRVVLIHYGRFGTTYRSHLQGQRCLTKNLGILVSKNKRFQKAQDMKEHEMAGRESRLLDAFTHFGAHSTKTSQSTSQSSGIAWGQNKTICFRQLQAERCVRTAYGLKSVWVIGASDVSKHTFCLHIQVSLRPRA